MTEMVFVIYVIVGYWAAGHTIYANKIRIGTAYNLVLTRIITAMLIGWILIPWAFIKKLIK